MMAIGDKAREVLLMLSSKYELTTDRDETDLESANEVVVKINQKDHVTEDEIKKILKPIACDGYTFHICSVENIVGVLIECEGKDYSIELPIETL